MPLALRDTIASIMDARDGDYNGIVSASNEIVAGIQDGNTRSSERVDTRIPGYVARRLNRLIGNGTLAVSAWSNEIADRDTMIDTADGLVTDADYESGGSQCDVCELVYRYSDLYRFRTDSGHICDACVDSEGAERRGDGYYFLPGDDGFADEEDEDGDEDGEEDGANEFIVGYSCDVLRHREPFLHTTRERTSKTTLWLGVELEVQARDEDLYGAAQAVSEDTASFAILKRDGSLPRDSFEIVSVPATLAWHRAGWNKFFTAAARTVRGWSVQECGMHVHLARDAITTLTFGKMLVFVNSNENRTFIENVAGRSSSTYSQLFPKKISDGCGRVMANHYDALSVSAKTGYSTIELRIFRSNVAKRGFLKNLEFAHALVMFCAQASIAALYSASFLRWLDAGDQRATYPYLTGWAARQGLLQAEQDHEKLETA